MKTDTIKKNRIPWIAFILLSFLSLFIWLKFSPTQSASLNLSVNRTEAINIAKNYLKNQRNVDLSYFKTAIILKKKDSPDLYLQKTIGFVKLKEFIKKYKLTLFTWNIRFFRENEKEEYVVHIDPSTKEVIFLIHIIDDNISKEPISKKDAKKKGIQFLKKNFDFDPGLYTLRSDIKDKFDNRYDFLFSWQKNSVNIPWNKKEDSGTGKLITSVKISGNEILLFEKDAFSVPDQFKRYIKLKQDSGYNFLIIVKFFYYALLSAAVFFIIIRRNHLAIFTVKKFYISITGISLFLIILSNFNQIQFVLFNYETSSPLTPFLWRLSADTILNSLFISIVILMPGLAGESLHYEVFKNKQEGSILYYIRTTFFSRNVAKFILLGYLVCIIMLGIQSFLIKIGQQYFDVWITRTWIENMSTSYFPPLTAFILGFYTCFSEEIMFRMFFISLGKKIFRNTLLVAIISSVVWGFAHSNYPVYPIWFRGIELTFIGLFLSFVYLKYGFIPVIIGHYLFNVFWNSVGYLFNTTCLFYFYGALFVLLLPLIFAALAFFINKKETLRPMLWNLNKHQMFNMNVLKTFLNERKTEFNGWGKDKLIKELCSHGWDLAIVEEALKNNKKKRNKWVGIH